MEEINKYVDIEGIKAEALRQVALRKEIEEAVARVDALRESTQPEAEVKTEAKSKAK